MMVSEDNLSHLAAQHLQNRPIYVFAPFSPAKGAWGTHTPPSQMKTYSIFLSRILSEAQKLLVHY